MPQLRELDLAADVNAFVENLMLERNLQFSDKESLLNVITAHLQASARPTKEVATDSGDAADGNARVHSLSTSQAANPTLLMSKSSVWKDVLSTSPGLKPSVPTLKPSVPTPPHPNGELAALGSYRPQRPLAVSGPHTVWVRPRVGDVRFGGFDAYLAPVVLPTAEAKLWDLRSLIGKTLQWPQERVQRVTFTRTLEDGGMVALSDAEPAMSAHGFYIRTARQATTARPTATRASLAALQRELLKGLRAAGLNHGNGLPMAVVREVQATILPHFGFDSSPSGIKAMEAAFDYYMPDSELLQRADEIYQAIGILRGSFDISSSKP